LRLLCLTAAGALDKKSTRLQSLIAEQTGSRFEIRVSGDLFEAEVVFDQYGLL
jgi:hypothetical protein